MYVGTRFQNAAQHNFDCVLLVLLEILVSAKLINLLPNENVFTVAHIITVSNYLT